MSILCLLLFTFKWQVFYTPMDDTTFFKMHLLLTIPANQLRFTYQDSTPWASYEIQILVFDKKGNQVAGDYWLREAEEDRRDIYDSVTLVIPNIARKFNLRIIDLAGTEILNVSENITPINFLANIRSKFRGDTIYVNYTTINPRGLDASLNIYFLDMKKTRPLKLGINDDTVTFFVATIPNGRYEMKFVIIDKGKRIDAYSHFVEIDRPFYLDDKTWYLKVSQLEYIATPSELNRLKKARMEERDSLWKAFWKQYDPTPNTDYNEKEIEYFERIQYAEEHFSFGDKGWRSDRGRIYVKFGPPDEVVSRPYELSTKPYEIWYYYRLNLRFIFYDRYGFGEYILINPQGERI